MSVDTLETVRKLAGLTQGEMASRIGLGLSAYEDLKNGLSSFKTRHKLALERASLTLAVEQKNINLAVPSVRRDALDLAKLITDG